MRKAVMRQRARTLTKAIRHPGAAAVRLLLMARAARSKPDLERSRLLRFLSHNFGVDARALCAEYRDSEFVRWFRARRAELRAYPGPSRLGTTGGFGCEALYLLVRAARPKVVADTGVLYGASSGHILAALAANGEGQLHSIELGADPDEPAHDFLVPPALKERWELILGDSRQELPALLERLSGVDLFHHDSLHTFEHMTWEFETALPCVRPGGVISSDDVLRPHSLRRAFAQNAFPAFCARHRLRGAGFRNFGFALRGG